MAIGGVLGGLLKRPHRGSLLRFVLSVSARSQCRQPPCPRSRSIQSNPQPTTSVRRSRQQDGLPSNVVNDVLQTRDGFLIVGSANGVFRFDGHRFAEMNSDPPKEIIVHSLAEGPDGDLWVATRFGVYRFPHAEIDQRTQTLSVYHLGQGAPDSVRCLRFTRAGVLWAGTPDGLFYFAKDHFQQVAAGNVQRIEEAPERASARHGHPWLLRVGWIPRDRAPGDSYSSRHKRRGCVSCAAGS